MSIALLTS